VAHESVTTTDPFGIVGSAVDDRVVVTIGEVDISCAVETATTQAAIGEMSSAILYLHPGEPVLAEADFTAEVAIGRGGADLVRRVFTGNVVSARWENSRLRVDCVTSPALRDPMPGAWVTTADPLDQLYALLRESGVPDERIDIEGIERLPTQVFEVVAPVDGLVLTEAVRVGVVTFAPGRSVASLLSGLGTHNIIEQFRSRSAFGVAYVTHSRQVLAERAGLRLIDSSLAWVNVRLRYANPVQPTGAPSEWSRAQLRQLAVRSDLVAVRALSTGSAWVRQRRPQPVTEVVLSSSAGPDAAVALHPQQGATGLRAAATAAARALSATDPITRITAISECLEFYVGRTKAPKKFTRQDRKKLLTAASGFSHEKKKRVEELVGDLNKASLLARLRYRLALDGVPISNSEMELLGRLREQRNDLVHGKRDEGDEQELDRAVALLARILLHAAHKYAVERPTGLSSTFR
jgi:hypothetical protein